MKNGNVAAVLLACLSVCIFLLVVFDRIIPFGWQIVQADLTTDYLLGVLWAVLLGLGILIWPVKSMDKRSLVTAWIARCLITLVVMLFYENHFGIDSFWYFEISTDELIGKTVSFKLGAGTENIMVLARCHAQIFPNSFHLMKVSFSMVGFIATWIFYRAAVCLLKREDIRIFIVLSLFPSMIFWSSTLGKDPIVMLGIALYVYGVSAWYITGKVRHLITMSIGVWIAVSIRIWLGPILLAPMAVFMLTRVRGLFPRILFIGFFFGAFLYAGSKFQEQFKVDTSADLISTIEGRANSGGWRGNTASKSIRTFSNLGDVLAFLPIGVFSALFRPLPGELFSVFGVLAGAENLVLVGLLILAIMRTRLSELKDPRLLWALVLILSWSSIYGFISYQNLGAAVRFRLQILPVLLCTLLYLRRERRLEKTLVQQ